MCMSLTMGGGRGGMTGSCVPDCSISLSFVCESKLLTVQMFYRKPYRKPCMVSDEALFTIEVPYCQEYLYK